MSDQWTWTDAHIETLRSLWAKHSASEVAAELNSLNGHLFSRNAVIGKAMRLGLPKKQVGCKKHKTVRVPEPKPKKPIKRDIMHPKPVPLPKVPPVPLVAKNLSIMELTSTTCRWPIGDPRNAMTYCGCEKPVTDSYCEWHKHAAYQADPNKSKRLAHQLKSSLRRAA